jgi:hypothetical protein
VSRVAAFARRHAGTAAAGVILAVGVLLGWLWTRGGGDDAIDRFAFRSTAAPAEYAYLRRPTRPTSSPCATPSTILSCRSPSG